MRTDCIARYRNIDQSTQVKHHRSQSIGQAERAQQTHAPAVDRGSAGRAARCSASPVTSQAAATAKLPETPA
ncbi:hypothetical protein E2562_032854 [Oryza meyeriana var. granulata]|uniref:Uncharacterized protein n=1 Tax=Oryza meyeriana var. granulata TaxID=110450 RepID=A0A6G1DS65_9ORYZ|nr:hypothetical protein E2562_032854 [Oryza meyeriana var. granulata]